jgi:hypothetical protein
VSDRRTFLIQMGALTASVSVGLRLGVTPVPVVGFFLDQPYLDLTGQATPYIPPAGLRSAQPLAASVAAAFHQGIWFQQDQS